VQPLVREGRMDKFFFEPTREEMAAALCPLFSPGLAEADVDALLAAFPRQPLDFFGALRSRLADGAVRGWLAAAAEAGGGTQVGPARGRPGECSERQLLACPTLSADRKDRVSPARTSGVCAQVQGVAAALEEAAAGAPPPLVDGAPSLAAALEAGRQLAAEQQAVLDVRLSLQYMKGLEAESQPAMRQRRAQWRQAAAERAARAHAAAEAAEAVRRAAAEASLATAAAQRAESASAVGNAAEAQQRQQPGLAADSSRAEQAEEEGGEVGPAAAAATPSGLPGVTPDELAAALRDRSVTALDVRSDRDWGWGRVAGAAHAPVVLAAGTALAPEVRRNPGFLAAAAAVLGPPGHAKRVVLYGPGAPLDVGTKQRHVSKEVFVSVAPNGAAEVDGQVGSGVDGGGAVGWVRVRPLVGRQPAAARRPGRHPNDRRHTAPLLPEPRPQRVSAACRRTLPRLCNRFCPFLTCPATLVGTPVPPSFLRSNRILWRRRQLSWQLQGTTTWPSWQEGTAHGTWRTAPTAGGGHAARSETSRQASGWGEKGGWCGGAASVVSAASSESEQSGRQRSD
jgi:hypothetical protein